MEKIKVLLVEDEPTLAMIIKDTLDGNEFDITLAANGEEGLSRYAEIKPDIIVADIMMPKMDGMEVLRRLRPDLVVERFASEAPPRYHYGRNWGLVRNEQLLAMLEKRLEERNVYQGEIFTTFAADKLRQR